MKIIIEKTEHGYQVLNNKDPLGMTHPDLTFAEVVNYLEVLLEENLERSQKETREKWEIKMEEKE